MKIGIYYGGRGIVDDPSLYVADKMAEVLRELNVQVTTYKLFEQNITTLSGTLKDADGIILASTVEWFGIGGYMMQFLDACWLYTDKDKIRSIYMMPVVMSTTYGEREGVTSLETAWEILGGLLCDGICGYITDTSEFEKNAEYRRLLEKKAENFYRTISQKMPGLPTSNQAVKQKVSLTRSQDLTPQESEQLSHYVSDEKYVETQKADIKELSSIFRDKLKEDENLGKEDYYISLFKDAFTPDHQVHGSYGITLGDKPQMKTLIINASPSGLGINAAATKEIELDVAMQMTGDTLDDIVSGRMTFQRAFMAGNMKMKGDFRLLRGLDQIFRFKAETD